MSHTKLRPLIILEGSSLSYFKTISTLLTLLESKLCRISPQFLSFSNPILDLSPWKTAFVYQMTLYRFFFGIAILSDLAPKTNHMFHFTGKNQSTPNCPVQLVANFNPGTGSQSFRSSDKNCTKPAQYRLPFYLKDMGPRYNAISVGAHEARPGHHTQVRYLGQFSCCCC